MVPLNHMYAVRNAGSVSACSLMTTQVREAEVVLVCVWLPNVSVSLFAVPDVVRKQWVKVGESPPHHPPARLQKKEKCGFIAASPGHRASGLSLPHHNIISWALSSEK